MQRDYKQYQQEVTDDISTVLRDAGCQPILFIGSGFSKRYAGAPNWEELLRKLAENCPLIDKDYAYYKQTYSDPMKIGSVFADAYREWAWGKGRSKFPDLYFTESYPSDIFLKHTVTELLKGMQPTKNSNDAAMLAGELEALRSMSPHAIVTTNYDEFIEPLFNGVSSELVMLLNELFWWLHIVGILIFMNYLYFSKHLHILLAFPNTYFADLNPKGKFDNLESVTNEVKLMMDPNVDPYAAAPTSDAPSKFGASDIKDLNWVQLLNAYTCTECGRCTSSCPASQTGKKLSPRKIMMDTRDRIEEVGKNIDANKGVFVPDNKSLLNDYITPEELWACTSCNACVEECPVNISPLSIIMEMRRYLVMEQSAAPMSLNAMMTNIENNGAPWQYNQQDRLNWKNEQ